MTVVSFLKKVGFLYQRRCLKTTEFALWRQCGGLFIMATTEGSYSGQTLVDCTCAFKIWKWLGWR